MEKKINDKENEVLLFLKDMLQIKVAKEQMAHLTSNFVVDVFARFLNEFGFDHLDQIDLIASSGTRLTPQSAYPINVMKALSTFINPYISEPLQLSDILKTKRVRTIEILHALCNMYYCFYKAQVSG